MSLDIYFKALFLMASQSSIQGWSSHVILHRWTLGRLLAEYWQGLWGGPTWEYISEGLRLILSKGGFLNKINGCGLLEEFVSLHCSPERRCPHTHTCLSFPFFTWDPAPGSPSVSHLQAHGSSLDWVTSPLTNLLSSSGSLSGMHVCVCVCACARREGLILSSRPTGY